MESKRKMVLPTWLSGGYPIAMRKKFVKDCVVTVRAGWIGHACVLERMKESCREEGMLAS